MPRHLVVAGVIAVGLPACGHVYFDTSSDAGVDAAPATACAPGSVDVLKNGGFEDPAAAWSSAQVPADQPHSWFCPKQLAPRMDGMFAGCVGLTDGTEQTLDQSIAIPAGKLVTLRGKICIATQEIASTAYDVLTLEIRDGQTVVASLGQFTNRDGGPSCDFVPFQRMAMLSGAPTAATLRLSARLDAARTTTFYLDDLSLCVAGAP